ncbi:hypothetical protein KO465_09110 [Candidatus Micrarchaeota archaeon]|jgi:hypothetical protein|nr:hypothetical protein [Candidatus Micrarchaeota archaeon]
MSQNTSRVSIANIVKKAKDFFESNPQIGKTAGNVGRAAFNLTPPGQAISSAQRGLQQLGQFQQQRGMGTPLQDWQARNRERAMQTTVPQKITDPVYSFGTGMTRAQTMGTGLDNKLLPQNLQNYQPQTPTGQVAQLAGQVAGTLTNPLATPQRMAMGAGMGGGGQAISNLIQGKPIQEGVLQGASQGMIRSPIFGITDPATEKLLTKASKTLPFLEPLTKEALSGQVAQGTLEFAKRIAQYGLKGAILSPGRTAVYSGIDALEKDANYFETVGNRFISDLFANMAMSSIFGVYPTAKSQQQASRELGNIKGELAQKLGIDPDSSPEQYKAAWKQFALRNHPDRGGSHEVMSDINKLFKKFEDITKLGYSVDSAKAGDVETEIAGLIPEQVGQVAQTPKIEPSVVQIIDQNTGEKTFQTIPQGKLNKAISLIDDTQQGIAGKMIDGKVYHLTAKTPEQMKLEGFKDGGEINLDEIPKDQARIRTKPVTLDTISDPTEGLKELGYNNTQIKDISRDQAMEIIKNKVDPFEWEADEINKRYKRELETKRELNKTKIPTIQDELTEEEVDVRVAEALQQEIAQPRLKSWFNDIFNPLKNAPEDVRGSVLDWRRSSLVARAEANRMAFNTPNISDIPEDDGWKIVQYAQSPTDATAKKLGLDIDKYDEAIDSLRNSYDVLRQQGIDKGLDIGYLDNYVNQVWKESPEEIIRARGLSGKPSFTKEKVIPSYEEGIALGLTPKFTHPSQLIAHYKYQLDRALANQQLADDLLSSDHLLPASKAPKDWQRIDAPFFPKSRTTMGKTLIVEDYKAPPSVAKPINSIFEYKSEGGVLKFTADVARTMQEVRLAAGFPNTPVNSFGVMQVIKQATAGRIKSPVVAFTRSMSEKKSLDYLKSNDEYFKMMAEEGISNWSEYDYSEAHKNLMEDSSLKEVVGEKFDKWFGEATFKRFMPMLRVDTFKDTYNSGIKGGMAHEEARKLAADTLKNFDGIVDNFDRPENVKNAVNTTFMAPYFREAMINFWVNNVKAINPKNFSKAEFNLNRRFLIGTVLTYLLYDQLNRRLTGKGMHENKGGKELSLEIPVSPGRSWFIPILPSISTVPRRTVEIAGSLIKGDIAGATERLGTYFSMPISTGSQLLSNQTFYGAPIYQQDDPALSKLAKLGGYAFEQTAHPYIGEPMAVLQGRKTPTEAALGALEMPVYPSRSSDVAHLVGSQFAKFKDLAEQNVALAMDYASQAKIQSATNKAEREAKAKLEKSAKSGETEITEGKLYYYDKSEDTVSFINLDKIREVADMPESNRYETALKETERWKEGLNILTRSSAGDIPKSQTDQLYEALGLEKKDVEYYDIARQKVDLKTLHVLDEIEKIAKTKDRPAMLKYLAEGRREINGQILVSKGVLDNLVDEGLLSKAEATQLNNLKFDSKGTPSVKLSGRGSGVRLKKVTPPKPSQAKLVDQRTKARKTRLTTPTLGGPAQSEQFAMIRAPQLSQPQQLRARI